jgi:hypothetical protein
MSTGLQSMYTGEPGVSCSTTADEASYSHPVATSIGAVILLVNFGKFP